jgi:hypothetical protein
MISSSKKGAHLEDVVSPNERGRALGMAALVAFVWAIAALPFFVGAVRCPTAHLFHFPCPGCGMTRAFHLLALGQIKDSLTMHPMAVPTLLAQAILAVATIASTFRFGAPWSLMRASWGRAAVWIIGIVLVLDILLWIARAAGAFGGPVPV